MPDAERDQLRRTFDEVAELYHAVRPDYPPALYDDLVELASLQPQSHRLLEVGCGTGKATVPLADQGFHIVALEPGARLAAVARRTLARFPSVEVVESDFEQFHPASGDRFHLVYAATAWHWVDPIGGPEHAWALLAPGGHLAYWSATHVLPEDGDPFFTETQAVYDEIGEGLPPEQETPRPGRLPNTADQILAGGWFQDVAVRQYDWEVSYDGERYVDLLSTFSGHIAMAPWQRERLFSEIRRRLAQRPDGSLRRHWGAALHVARRRET